MGRKGNTSRSIDSLLWGWTEKPDSNITDEEVKTAYRLRLSKCNDCRKNCSGNPSCLHGLGESYWMNSTKSADDEVLQKLQNKINSQHRKTGELVGLRNLGATCYVNTYLQLWFHNIQFRNAIYALKEETFSNGENPFQTLCGQLQLMFGLLQNSASKFVDPSSFIKCLQLPTDLQQDAQEFSKLFMCLLETTPGLSDIIQNQFSGKYAYVTKCLSCNVRKTTPAQFFELDLSIQEHKDLKNCIVNFLKEEQLQSDNQYFCENCDSKQDAVRQIVLKELPQTLSIQLLRFVYDRSSQQKRKINTNLSFPDKLNFLDFLNSKETSEIIGGSCYQLTAVLLHRGPSACSGHFVANILDSTSGCWYKFNDEVVAKVKSGKKLDLDACKDEDNIWCDIEPEPTSKRPKISKGNHSSKDVYMLVYSKISSESTVANLPMPVHVQKLVEERNNEFENELMNTYLTAEEEQKKQQDFDKTMNEFIKALTGSSEVHQWVPTAHLKQFLSPSKSKPEKRKSLSNLLCSHGNINLEAISLLKRIPKSAADIMYANSTNIAHLTDDMLCRQCVQSRCMLLQGRRKLTEDSFAVSENLKLFENNLMSEPGHCYYIGRQSLRRWKTLAQQKLQKKYQPKSIESNNLQATNCLDSFDSEEFVFNSDAFCMHGNLTVEENSLQLVPQSVWDVLVSYFPKCDVFKLGECIKCPQCLSDAQKEDQDMQLKKALALTQKSALNQLYANKNRPSYVYLFESCPWKTCVNEYFYAVSDQFVNEWKEFVRHSSKNQPVEHVNNSVFLCQHNNLLYNPLVNATFSSEGFEKNDTGRPYYILLWEKEWDFIKDNFVVDHTIRFQKRHVTPCSVVIEKIKDPYILEIDSSAKNGLSRLHSDKKPENDNVLALIHSDLESSKESKISKDASTIEVTHKPELCLECMKGLANEEQRKLKSYNDAEIYVIKSTKSLEEMQKQSPNSSSVEPPSDTRRTTRIRRCARGEKKITSVSSKMTLKELKLKIMSTFSVPPFDQNLWLDGVMLNNDEAILENLSILPGCTITLVEDLPNLSDVPIIMNNTKTPELEVGFLGTGLLGHS